MREFHFHFTVACAGQGHADRERVEQMIDLVMQELVFDDEFIAALDEKEAVTIQVIPVPTPEKTG
jgi:Holliday junction resolvasome RuvABC endonuclease subunit